jgi:hypothetical protein
MVLLGTGPKSGTLGFLLLDNEPPLRHETGVSLPLPTAVSLRDVPVRPMESAMSFSSWIMSPHGSPGLFSGDLKRLSFDLVLGLVSSRDSSSPMHAKSVPGCPSVSD